MENRYRKIIDAIKKSRVKMSIVRLFKDSPYIMDTLQGLASWAFVPAEQAAAEVEDLVSMGVLRRYGQGPSAVYRYTNDETMRECIDCYWKDIERERGDAQRRGM